MKKEVVAEILKPHGFILDEERPIQYGVQLIFRNGAKVSVYDSGKVNPQGKHFDLVSKLLGLSPPHRQAVTAHNADDMF